MHGLTGVVLGETTHAASVMLRSASWHKTQGTVSWGLELTMRHADLKCIFFFGNMGTFKKVYKISNLLRALSLCLDFLEFLKILKFDVFLIFCKKNEFLALFWSLIMILREF